VLVAPMEPFHILRLVTADKERAQVIGALATVVSSNRLRKIDQRSPLAIVCGVIEVEGRH
jgi:hypothetical protein